MHLSWIVAICSEIQNIPSQLAKPYEINGKHKFRMKVHVPEPESQKLHWTRLWGSVSQNRETKKTYLAFSLKFQNLLEFLKSHEYSLRSLDSKIWNFRSQIQKVKNFNELVRAVPSTKIGKQKKPIWRLRWSFRIFWNFWNRMSSLWDLWIWKITFFSEKNVILSGIAWSPLNHPKPLCDQNFRKCPQSY